VDFSLQGKVAALIRWGGHSCINSLVLFWRRCLPKITTMHLNVSKLRTEYCG